MLRKNPSYVDYLLVILLLHFLFQSCDKEDPAEPPALTTSEVTEVKGNSAKSGGNITDDGRASVTSRGVVWSTSENPTTNNNEGSTSDGIGEGQFASNLTGLTPGTTYFIRAYAENSAGTAYGNQEQFTTLDLASVTTGGITDVSSRTATSGGNITDDGGAEITARGVVWGTYNNPAIDNYIGKTTDGSGTGSFVSELTELKPGTTYYVRAYAENLEGISYGDQVEFKTKNEPFLCGNSFNDLRDGTLYNTVQIGDQCWLKEDLKYLPEVYPSSSASYTEAWYYVYGYNGTDITEAIATDNYQNYGVLYNWPAAMNGEESSSTNPSEVQGVCPAGWHLPGDGEWTQMLDYLMNEYNLTNSGLDKNGVGNKLKSCRQANSPLGGECNTTEHPRWSQHSTHYGTDEFGFSALPGGGRYSNGLFSFIGDHGLWWSSSEASSTSAWTQGLTYNYGSLFRYDYNKASGFSVRCVRYIDN